MNYTITRVWGIPIRVNISLIIFLPILAWLIGSGEQLAAYGNLINTLTTATVDATVFSDSERWIIGTLAAVGLFVSVTLHELGHAWAAMRYDIGVESITLWILGGLADLSEMPREWQREFWIAIAGPITSVAVGAACLGALLVVPESVPVAIFLLGLLGVMNVVLAVFNMLPAFPMDGGRVLRSLLARNRPYVSATRTAARIGTGFALLFVFIGIFVSFSPILILLALFIYMAATGESRSVVLGELLDGLTVEDIVADVDPISADATVGEALDRLLGSRRSELVVVDEGTVVGVITASTLRDVAPEAYETTTVRDRATMDLPRFDSTTPAFDALTDLQSQRSDIAVVEREGKPVNLVSRADFAAVLSFRGETVAF